MKKNKHMLFKQIFSTMFLVALFYGVTLGQAGSDQDVCEGESVTIGATGSGDKCYKWSPETGLSDPKSPNPEASPTETTTYTVTVVGQDFSSRTTDQVTVTVVDLNSVSAMPKKCCWKKEENITSDQFEITVDPPSVKDQITVTVVSPTQAPPVTFATGEVEVTLRVTCGSSSEDITTMIKVVDEDFEISATPYAIELNGFEEKLERWKNTFPKKLQICSPSVSLSGSMSIAKVYLCCSGGGECIRTVGKITGAASVGGGFSCEFPLPYSIPYVASANVVLGLGINGTFEATSMLECDGDSKKCVEAKIGGSLTGGLSGDIFGDKVLKVQAVIIASASMPTLKYCNKGGLTTFGRICGKVDAEGSVTLVSWYKKSFHVNIISQRCIN